MSSKKKSSKEREEARVWVKLDEDDGGSWESGTIRKKLRGKDNGVIVVTRGGRTVNSDKIYYANPSVVRDMTSLWHIHEPGILHNLEKRSLQDEPYTFMGPVLVAVNPLRTVAPPKHALGKAAASTKAHPWAVAEVAYQQMIFGNNNRMRREAAAKMAKKSKKSKSKVVVEETPEIINQSVVVSGESGAGKTESSKMVLEHLVARSGGGALDKKLLCSNPILESFGNATTLRNHNSSRFGKFLKLHFNESGTSIDSASVETYLLELSRISQFELGERNYHIFYELLAGTPKSELKALGFDSKSKMRILKPVGKETSKLQLRTRDKSNFVELKKSFKSMGIKDEEAESVYKLVAGVIHLGDVMFEDQERSVGEVATVKKDSQGSLKSCCTLLGLSKDQINALFSERVVTVRGDQVTTYRNAKAASQTRNSLITALYSRLFLWIVGKISSTLSKKKKSAKGKESSMFIGVLDIFGFESFIRNDFEQLLINFTNESLQATFNHQVFQAELDLFKREGLSIDNDESIVGAMPSNKDGMELFLGNGTAAVPGLLTLIVQEGQAMKGTDSQMVKRMHDTYTGKNPCFKTVHPKDKGHQFIIGHYAGNVTYTIGNFLRKNQDQLTDDVGTIMAGSTSEFVAQVWGVGDGTTTAPTANGKGRKPQSIIAKFKVQIANLMTTIEVTRCSFIRCVKPNPSMERVGTSIDWFDHKYVTKQLHCLSIPQTALVLKSGFPTRVDYSTLKDMYLSVLPKDSIKVWKTLGGKSDTGFVAALFWAFKIPRDNYKLGITKVFFKSGMLSTLDNVLKAASEWGNPSDGKKKSKDALPSKKEVSARFRQYHARRRWRKCFAAVLAASQFLKMLEKLQNRGVFVAKIQALFRGYKARLEYSDKQWAAVMIQKNVRTAQALGKYNKMVMALAEKAVKEAELEAEKEKEKLAAAEKKAKKEAKARAKEESKKAKQAKAAQVEKKTKKGKKKKEEQSEPEAEVSEMSAEELARQEKIRKNRELFEAGSTERLADMRELRRTQVGSAKLSLNAKMAIEKHKQAKERLLMVKQKQERRAMNRASKRMSSRTMKSVFASGRPSRSRASFLGNIPEGTKSSKSSRTGRRKLIGDSGHTITPVEIDDSDICGLNKGDVAALEILEELEIDTSSKKEEISEAVERKRKMSRSNWEDSDDEVVTEMTTVDDQPKSQRKSVALVKQSMAQAIAIKERRAQSIVDASKQNSGSISGYAYKLAIVSKKNWKKRFLVFNPARHTISYYSKQFQTDEQKVKFSKGCFVINHGAHQVPPGIRQHSDIRGKKNVLEIIGGAPNTTKSVQENFSLFLYFDSEKDLHKWNEAIQDYLNASLESAEGLDQAAINRAVKPKKTRQQLLDEAEDMGGNKTDILAKYSRKGVKGKGRLRRKQGLQNAELKGRGNDSRLMEVTAAHLAPATLEFCKVYTEELLKKIGRKPKKGEEEQLHYFIVDVMLLLEVGSIDREGVDDLLTTKAKQLTRPKKEKGGTLFNIQICCNSCEKSSNYDGRNNSCVHCGHKLVEACATCSRDLMDISKAKTGATGEYYCSEECLTKGL